MPEIEKKSWSPFSWKNQSAYFPQYRCPIETQKVCEFLKKMPVLVTSDSIRYFSTQLNRCAEKNAFIIHSGECAELFSDCIPEIIFSKMALSHSLKKSLEDKIQKEVISIERMAGQYAKPRMSHFEFKGDICLPAYFGDMFNSIDFTVSDRELHPNRMIAAYHAAKKTIAHCQSNVYFLSHEALNLYYEAAFTKEINSKYFNLSTHFPWIGMRTVTSPAHLEYISGIANPIGIKVGTNINSHQ